MTVHVLIPTALRRFTAGAKEIECAVADLPELLVSLEQSFPELKGRLRDDAGEVRRFLNIYVNEEDIRFLGGPGYRFNEGDEVMLVPSIAGGATPYFLSSSLLKSSAAEFMQYRIPVGVGLSLNKWPRCASQRAQRTSVLVMP